MTELIDVKLKKKTKEELKGEPCTAPSLNDQEKWPYGLKLTFEKDQIDKMASLKGLNFGDKVLIQAEASVIEVSISERQGGDEHHTVGIQIEKISVELAKPKKPENMTMKEFRAMREKKE